MTHRGTTAPSVPTVAMCAGKACRGRAEHEPLRERLAAETDLGRFRCVGVCAGPVVVVTPPGDAPVVVARVRSPKAQRDVVRLLRGRPLSDRLRRRRVGGSKAAKAIRRATER